MLLLHLNIHFIKGSNPLINHKPSYYEITDGVFNGLEGLERHRLVLGVLAHVGLVWVLVQTSELLLVRLEDHGYFNV
jgi:hypothetical protein